MFLVKDKTVGMDEVVYVYEWMNISMIFSNVCLSVYAHGCMYA